MALIALAPIVLTAVGVAFAARLVVRQWRRVNAALKAHEHAAAKNATSSLPTLRPDPRTGIFTPDGSGRAED
ncbi:MAG: hypothetical protein HY056_16890 [Proteobacteria bacterium]|nr:hypothetical protein [Pseudomonadota bacterium]